MEIWHLVYDIEIPVFGKEPELTISEPDRGLRCEWGPEGAEREAESEVWWAAETQNDSIQKTMFLVENSSFWFFAPQIATENTPFEKNAFFYLFFDDFEIFT